MDEVKPSVNQQLEQIDSLLDAHVQADSPHQAFTEVLSSEGLHAADMAPEPVVSSHPLSRTVAFSGGEALSDVPNLPQGASETLYQTESEALVPEPLLESVTEISLTPEFHDQLAQVLASFSDSWVNEMTQRIGDLREQIALVHNKLDQFSPR
jgi:hypothetical protein